MDPCGHRRRTRGAVPGRRCSSARRPRTASPPPGWARDALAAGTAPPAARGGRSVPHPLRPGRHRRARPGRSGRSTRLGLHGGLPPAVLRPQRGRAAEGAAHRRAPGGADHHRPVALGRLVRTGTVGHVRRDRGGPSRPAAHPHAALVGGAPAAQGPPQPGDRDGHVLPAARRRPALSGSPGDRPGRARGLAAARRAQAAARPADGVPQRGSAAPGHPRPHPGRPRAARTSRSSTPSPTSAFITGGPRRSASVRPGTPTSPTPTGWTISAACSTTCPTS